MWYPGKEDNMVRVDWQAGSLLVPPEGWYHHHFTTSKEAARHSRYAAAYGRWAIRGGPISASMKAATYSNTRTSRRRYERFMRRS